MSGYFTEHCADASSLGNLIFPESLKKFRNSIFLFCILLFELPNSLEMFWRWCRNAFSNVAKQGIILLLEPLFVFNPICQAVKRERERALHLGENILNYINSVQFVWSAKVHWLGKFFCDMFNQTFVQKTLDFALKICFL
jgi:hypothetical protein